MECKHAFTHVVNKEEMVNQYKSRWSASRVTIYCTKCGIVSHDKIQNGSGI